MAIGYVTKQTYCRLQKRTSSAYPNDPTREILFSDITGLPFMRISNNINMMIRLVVLPMLFVGAYLVSERLYGTPNLKHAALVIEKSSRQNIYHASIRPFKTPVPIGELHDWLIHLTTISGELFIPEQLVIKGGMPGHGHGFPVEPKISRYLGNGDFLLQGVKFNMTGDWQLRLGVNGPAGWDTITFSISVTYPSDNIMPQGNWSASEIAIMKSLSLSQLSPVESDPSNRFSSNHTAAEFGKKLFFDPRLSRSGKVSCATCHQPERLFSDGKKLGFGSAQTKRHTPSLSGVAHNQWFYWDGRRDSLWSQAVTPIESKGEMDNNRVDVVRYVLSRPDYSTVYRQLTGSHPEFNDKNRFPSGAGPYSGDDGKAAWSRMRQKDRYQVNAAFANIGKFVAAYEQTLTVKPGRFDRFVDLLQANKVGAANKVLTKTERAGLRLFLDTERTQCLRCHNGPLFTNHGFHNVGTGVFEGQMTDFGRYFGLQSVSYDTFNCEGPFSDADPEQCVSLRFMLRSEIPAFMQGAFKVPSLRNVADTAPYLHDGRFPSLSNVIDHYREPPEQMNELNPIKISDQEAKQLEAFLNTLSESP